MTKAGLGLFVLVLGLSTPAGRPNRDMKANAGKPAAAVQPQPISFSHKKHAFILCSNCHSGATQKEQAGFPDIALCMMCHSTIKTESKEIQALSVYYRSGRKVKWVRIYTLPDFVFFSHAAHHQAGITCVDCHGPVSTRDVLVKEKSMDMVACMKCHVAKKASTDCGLCHVLGH